MARQITDIRYIVVLFLNGIGYTLLNNDKPHIFFDNFPKVYKNFESARKKANKLRYEYTCNKVCVFKTHLEERLSCDQYNKWCNDTDRNVWDSSTF